MLVPRRYRLGATVDVGADFDAHVAFGVDVLKFRRRFRIPRPKVRRRSGGGVHLWRQSDAVSGTILANPLTLNCVGDATRHSLVLRAKSEALLLMFLTIAFPPTGHRGLDDNSVYEALRTLE